VARWSGWRVTLVCVAYMVGVIVQTVAWYVGRAVAQARRHGDF
jgi:hypothetical protein